MPRYEETIPALRLVNPVVTYGYRSASVSATSANKTEAVRWLDLAYSEEGRILYNFGIEDKTYTVEDGEPVLTEFARADMRRNFEQGAVWKNVMLQYARGFSGGSYVQSQSVRAQFYAAAGQTVRPGSNQKIEAVQIFTGAIFGQTEKGVDVYSSIMTDIEHYQLRSFVDFVTGQRPFEEYPEYLRKIRAMGIEKARDILAEAWRQFYAKPIK